MTSLASNMKLYELKRNTEFTLVESANPIHYRLDHIDGMYSVCYRVSDEEMIHLSASTPVEEVDESNNNLG